MDYKIIDCDQHVIEPPDLWEKYLPAKYQDRAPKLVRDEEGGDAWQLGKHIESLGLVAAKEVRPRDLKWTGSRYADMHPGIIDPAGRLELMDEDGIHRGGRIMPGLDMMRTSLLEHTEEINDIDGECPGFAINTADAVSSGTLHMLLAGLVEVCESARQRLGDDMEIIITGGMAETMLPLLDQPEIHHEPHLVLHGLFYASEQ